MQFSIIPRAPFFLVGFEPLWKDEVSVFQPLLIGQSDLVSNASIQFFVLFLDLEFYAVKV